MDSKRFLIAIIVAYIIILGSLATLRHLSFHSTAFDLGIYDQAVWGFANGRMLFGTVFGAYPFGDHPTPILFLIAPFYWLWSNPIALIWIQTTALALGALPVYWLSRKRFGEFAGKCLSLAYLLYPSLHYINLFDFHPDAFIIPFFLFAFHYLEEKKYRRYFLFVILAGMCKEYVGLLIMMLGLYIAVLRNRKIGIVTAVAGLLWFLINIKFVIPYYTGIGSYMYLFPYDYLGKTITQVILSPLLKPLLFAKTLLSISRIGYLSLMLLPLALLSVLAPEILLIALPAWAIILLQKEIKISYIIYQHNSLVIPFIFYAAIKGMERIRRLRVSILRSRRALGVMVVAASLVSLAAYGPLTQLYNMETFNINTQHVKAGNEIIKEIPKTASVSATTWAVPHLSQRERAYMFPNPFFEYFWAGVSKTEYEGMPIDYVLLDNSRKDISIHPTNMTKYTDYIMSNGDYEVIKENDGWVLLRRK